MLIWSFLRSNLYPSWTLAKIILCNSDETIFLSDCPSFLLGISIRCIQHSQTMLEREVCELAHSFFQFYNCFYLENYFNVHAQVLVDRTCYIPPRYFLMFRWSYIFPTQYQASVCSYFNISHKFRNLTVLKRWIRCTYTTGGLATPSWKSLPLPKNI